MRHATLYVTAPNQEAALKLARQLVESRLAACANVVGGAVSVYWWEGRVQEESEAILFLKTRAENVEALITKIKELHDYSCPCVTAWPIVSGNPAYLDWIDNETKSASSGF